MASFQQERLKKQGLGSVLEGPVSQPGPEAPEAGLCPPMKLLLVLDGVDYPTAANPQLSLRAAGALAEAGHTVHLLYLEDGRTPLPPPPAGFQDNLILHLHK